MTEVVLRIGKLPLTFDVIRGMMVHTYLYTNLYPDYLPLTLSNSIFFPIAVHIATTT
jgi:hypothetical protein